jgi:transcription elongation GreA/GreB family factor
MRRRYLGLVSKAFTKEDDVSDDVVVERLPPPREPAAADAQVAASGVVRAGAFVTLADEEGARIEYQVVEPEAADARARRISAESPLGRALLGKRAGDEVVVERPRGPAAYEIIHVRYAAHSL